MNNPTSSSDRSITEIFSQENEKFALRVQSKRRGVDRWVGITATSTDVAHQRFKDHWSGFEVEVRIPHHNGQKWETVFAPNERSAKAVATGRSGEYSDVPGEIQPLEIDVQVVEIVHKENVETLKQTRALDELSRIKHEVNNAE